MPDSAKPWPAVTSMPRLKLQDVQLPPTAADIDAFFQQKVGVLQQTLDGFDARLAWYVPDATLPAGEIGNPAKDIKSSGRFGDGHCGTFRPGNQNYCNLAIHTISSHPPPVSTPA